MDAFDSSISAIEITVNDFKGFDDLKVGCP